ncbi:hypothetical protein MG1601_445 [Mycoplasmoides gallisepticum]
MAALIAFNPEIASSNPIAWSVLISKPSAALR